jgi:hypothetical protein
MQFGFRISCALLMLVSLHLLSSCGGTTTSTQAQAGADQIAGPYHLITLNGGDSKAADGGTLSYHWKQLGNQWPMVSGSLTSAQVSFYIPSTGLPAQGVELELTVTDQAGKTNSDRVKILPETCTRSAGELFTDCLGGAKSPVQQDAQQGVLEEGYGNAQAFLQWALVNAQDSSRGKIIDIHYTAAPARQAYFAIQTAGGHPQNLFDVGAGFIEFDIRLVGGSVPEFFLKIERLSADQNVAIPVPLAKTNAWQHIKVPLQDYLNQELGLYGINRMFAIFPRADSQQAVHFQLDNIKWVAQQGGSIPDDYPLKPSSPLQMGFPAANGATAKVSANILGIGITPFANGPISPIAWEVQGNSINVTHRTDEGVNEIIIDLRDSWAANIGQYRENYSLRFNIAGVLSQASVFFTLTNGSERSTTSEQKIPFIIYAGELITLPSIEIPLSSFNKLDTMPVEALHIRYQSDFYQGNFVLSNFALVKSNSSQVAPINSLQKLGAPAQTGYIYGWDQLAGPDVIPINGTNRLSAQLEFLVPSTQSAAPLIFRRRTQDPNGVESEEILSLYRSGKCILPAGVLFEDCMEDRFGPAASHGSVTTGLITYYFPFPDISLAGGLYPVVAQEIISSDPGHNQIIDVTFKNADNYKGGFIFPYSDKTPINLSEFNGGTLELDLKVIDYGKSTAGLNIGGVLIPDYLLPVGPTNQWRRISLPIQIDSLNRPLVTEDEALFGLTSSNGLYSGIHFQLDNIRLLKVAN